MRDESSNDSREAPNAAGPGASSASAAGVAVVYFDGRTATARAACVAIVDGTIVLEGRGVSRRDAVASVEISAPIGTAPGRLSYPDGASCELPAGEGAARLLRSLGRRPAIDRLESKLRYGLGLLAATVLALAFAYRVGLPALAEAAASRVPEAALEASRASTLAALDQTFFDPSALDDERRERVVARFEALRLPGGVRPSHQIEFRSAPAVGANAIALPSGAIVVTDDLAALVDDDELVAVLSHELGHLRHRHSLRHVLQGSVAGLVTAWLLGDVGGALAGGSAALIEAKYSRDFEREADRYAAELLLANGASPAALASALEKLDEPPDEDPTRGRNDHYASHPRTSERIAQLRALATPAAESPPRPSPGR